MKRKKKNKIGLISASTIEKFERCNISRKMPYEILNISEHATKDQIDLAYNKHPIKQASLKDGFNGQGLLDELDAAKELAIEIWFAKNVK